MFQENLEDVKRADLADSITVGDYEADITGVSEQKPEGDKKGAWIVTFAITAGEFEGCEYTNFVTWSSKAAGIRAKFYRGIGYVLPEDGVIDHNDFLGQPALITIGVKGGKKVITNVQRSARAEDGSGDSGQGGNDGNGGF